MKLPGWLSSRHPIVRRDLAQWRTRRKALNWLWLLFAIPPLCGPVLTIVSLLSLINFSSSLSDLPPEFWPFAIVFGIIAGLWGLQWFLGLGITLFAVIGSAVGIAHERETSNWPMIRLTTLSAYEIVNAKIIAILRWLSPPVIAVLGLRVLCPVVTLLGFAYLDSVQTFFLTADDWRNLLFIAVTLLPIQLVATLTDILYHSAIGFASSTVLRNAGGSLAISFGAVLLLWVFIYLPVERYSYLWLYQSIDWLPLRSPSPLTYYLPLLFALYLAPTTLQIGLAIVAYGATLQRAQRLYE